MQYMLDRINTHKTSELDYWFKRLGIKKKHYVYNKSSYFLKTWISRKNTLGF